jgi:hypothetical protein
MKTFCRVVAVAALLSAAVATGQAKAQQAYGGGYTNIWSAAQGTSDSYGNAGAFDQSISGSTATGGGIGGSGIPPGGVTSAFTTSFAGTASFGNGYAQAQTSGYAGGTAGGYGGRSH